MAIKINLRRAAALQNVLHETIKGIEVEPNIEVNEWQEPAEILQTANAQLFVNDSRRNDLLMSIYTIRSLVATQNAMSGVSGKLSHMAYIDKRIAQLTDLVGNATKLESLDVIKGRLDKIRNRPADSRASLYHRDEDVRVCVLTQEQIDNIKSVIKELKKQKTNLNDEVLELNVRTEIELTPEVDAILSREGLI
jgi:hypothetical protein